MARWWVFPPRTRMRLFYRRDAEGELHYVVRTMGRIFPGLQPPWRQVPSMEGTWTAPGPRPPPVPDRHWRDLGGRLEELAGGDIRRRYELESCPPAAVLVGINKAGEEVREHEGRRWVLRRGADFADSWLGDEIAHPPERALRFGARKAWANLARSMVDRSSRGQQVLDEGELTALAAALVDPGRRPSFQPWTGDAGESRNILLAEMRAALLAPAAAGARPQWVEANTLERAVPDLRRGTAGDPPLSLAAAVAGVAGALREARLVGPDAESAWAGLFGGEEGGSRVVDARRMSPAAAARLLAEQSESAEGRVVGLLPGDPDQPDIDHALRSIACRRGIEAMLHLPTEALPDEPDGVTLISAGNLRPEPLPEPPPQALRVIRGEVHNDLRRWLDESLRGRARLAGEESSAARQAPYVPMSRIGQAKCTIARSHQVAASMAGRGLVERRGPVDGFVAGLLGTDDQGLEARYSPEQVDAIAMSEDAHLRGRAFLLADQTGTGKGRAAAGMAHSWLRRNPGNRVLYMTVGSPAADVIRDLRAVDALDETGRPVMLGADMPAVEGAHTPGDAERREILESRGFPENARFVICTYSSLQRGAAGDMNKTDAERRGSEWFVSVADDPRTMLILDEAHGGLNPGSNLGSTIRAGTADAWQGGTGRVAFVTATAMRSPEGVDLYRHLMPEVLRGPAFERRIQRALRTVGETAQESFITMLTEDGVMLRRDHDTGLVPYQVDTPQEAEVQRAAEVMRSVNGVAEELMQLARAVRIWYHRAQVPYRLRADGRGEDARTAQQQLERMMTGGFGGPLDQIARSVLVALKVDQAVRLAVTELREKGRKPLISLSSTGGTFLGKIHSREIGGPIDRPLDLRDLIRDVAERSCFVRGLEGVDQLDGLPVEEGQLDLRLHLAHIRRRWNRVVEAVEAMPAGLPVSPADALRAGLEREGVSCGEITGREYMVDADGEVVRREIPRKQEVARQYNSGELDVLIYNEAGGTGASYHASAEFEDRRPRTILQLELPLDVLRHLQSMGRGNRFDQVSIPEFVTISTDTLAEQRLLAGNNRKLRTVGAILDGDRDHPALAREVPDLFNRIGESACREVMRADRILAGRLDLTPDKQNLAKSIFTRAILLPEEEQERLFAQIVTEYEAQLAEAEAKGENPLKVPSMDGYVDIVSTEPYLSGQEGRETADDTVFNRPLMLSTGVWRRPPGLPAAAVSAAVLEAAESEGAGGTFAGRRFARDLAARWQQVSPTIGETNLPELINMLEAFEPGRILVSGAPEDNLVTIEYLPPERFMADRPFSHRFRCIQPGDGDFEVWSAAQLLKAGYRPWESNILNEDASWLSGQFDFRSTRGNRMAVQILSGDLLSVAGMMGGYASRRYRVCSFNDQTGASRRAAVNTAPLDKLDLTRLPFRMSASSLLDAAIDHSTGAGPARAVLPRASQERKDAKVRTKGRYRPWLINMRMAADEKALLMVTLPSMADRLRQSFWNAGTGPEIYRAATGKTLAQFRKDRNTVRERVTSTFRMDDPEQLGRARRLCALLDRHPMTDLLAPGQMRQWWGERGQDLSRERNPEFGPFAGGSLVGHLERALAAQEPATAARVAWPGGEIPIDAVPAPERAGVVMTLPPHDRRNAGFWDCRSGREIWEQAFGEPMPERTSASGSPPRTVFLEEDRALRVVGLIGQIAQDRPGWSVSAPVPGEPAPEAGQAPEMAA